VSDVIRGATIAELAASRALSRAALFRERAAQLRAIAEIEMVERVRDKLPDLADQYEGLAARSTNTADRPESASALGH